MTTYFRSLVQAEDGATAIEYGLIAALIAVALITAFQALGGSVSNVITTASDTMDGA
jgi:pilus assembly protein Flp/PilA